MKILLDMMKPQITEMFNQEDLEYRLYLQDHFKEIIWKGVTVTLSPNAMAEYEYRPKEYLRRMGHPPESDWLILWLNGILDREHFKRLNTLIIPNYSNIEDLYDQYRTLKGKEIATQKKLRKKIK